MRINLTEARVQVSVRAFQACVFFSSYLCLSLYHILQL